MDMTKKGEMEISQIVWTIVGVAVLVVGVVLAIYLETKGSGYIAYIKRMTESFGG